MTKRIKTTEEDSGLWSVYRGDSLVGYIWEPDYERRVMWKYGTFEHGRWVKPTEPYVPDQPQFVAVDDWVDHIMPGNPIEGCATWHKALHAVCAYRKQLTAETAPASVAA